MLRGLLLKFPFAPLGPTQASKCDDQSGAGEREKLLHESLAEHRRELKRLAQELLSDEKWQSATAGAVLTLSSETREVLLQILNDIRVGCWRALGEPADLEEPPASRRGLGHRTLMDLAGYFEMNLLEPDIMK